MATHFTPDAVELCLWCGLLGFPLALSALITTIVLGRELSRRIQRLEEWRWRSCGPLSKEAFKASLQREIRL